MESLDGWWEERWGNLGDASQGPFKPFYTISKYFHVYLSLSVSLLLSFPSACESYTESHAFVACMAVFDFFSSEDVNIQNVVL